MDKAKITIAGRRNKIDEAIHAVGEAIYRCRCEVMAGSPAMFRMPPGDEQITFDPPGREISAIRMGHAVHAEARHWSVLHGNTMIDYGDGLGPRVMIYGIIVTPTTEIDAWQIELS